jgi:signal transduction histidine kinase
MTTHDEMRPHVDTRRPGVPSFEVPRAVLCVDDDEHIRKALKRALRTEPYELLLAEDGPRALDILKHSEVQVVVSDLSLPGMDGISLLSTVAEHSPDIVRLVLSGRSDARIILEAINNGSIYRYILKPWDNDYLKIVIRQALDLWDLQAERQYLLHALQAHNRRLEEVVAQRTQQVLNAERQADIGRYASQIVHNLSNPLHAISGAIELVTTYVDNDMLIKEKLEKGLRIACSAADDLREMIAGILSHARHADQFTVQPMDVNAAIQKGIAFFDMIPEFKYNIKKELQLDPELPPIRGNPIQIRQILDNLIKNALDAMEESPVKRLTVQTAAMDEKVMIRVSDTGQGIATQHLDRIFASDFTTKPVGKGTGLGLASVKTMVEAYAGTIGVDSAVGGGTTFIIHLPALKEDLNKTQAFKKAMI